MDDYNALAHRVAVTVGDVRGCLILSRDGLVLGSYPEDDEGVAKPAWLRFAALGSPEKSVVEFPDQIWTYVHRGAYAAFAIAGTSIRPGVLIDLLEQALLTAEEARSKREPMKLTEAVGSAPSSKPRTAMHPEARPVVLEPADARSRAAAADAAKMSARAGAPQRPPAKGPEGSPGGPGRPPGPPKPPAEPAKEPPHHAPELKLMSSAKSDRDEGEEESEVDRVMLAQEFSRLLQESGSDDEETH
jgi:hypothetical protein